MNEVEEHVEKVKLDLKWNLHHGIEEDRVHLNRKRHGERTRQGWWVERTSSSRIASDPSAVSCRWTFPFSRETSRKWICF